MFEPRVGIHVRERHRPAALAGLISTAIKALAPGGSIDDFEVDRLAEALEATGRPLGAPDGECPKCGGVTRLVHSDTRLSLCRQCEHGAACPPAMAAIKDGNMPALCRQCEDCGNTTYREAPVLDWKTRAWMARVTM